MKRRELDYKIVKAHSLETLERFVKFALDDGWRPAGGAFMATQVPLSYAQAMVRNC